MVVTRWAGLLAALGVFLCILMHKTAGCSCNTTTAWRALTALYESTNGAGWRLNGNWLLMGSNVCDWYGVKCHSGESPLIDLNLGNNSIHGTIPHYFALLPNLETLNISDNNISGTIPDTFCNWNATLKYVYVDRNRLNGVIPAAPRCWASVSVWYSQRNELSGPLPALHLWPRLVSVYLDFNFFTGTLPESLAECHLINHVSISNNSLSGSLPAQLSRWGTSIVHFNVGSNNLSGTLPAQYGNWTSLLSFYGDQNNFSGSLPDAYLNWSSLRLMFLFNNNLIGTVPDSYGSAWRSLNTFTVGHNHFEGSLPPSFGNCLDMQEFSVDNNRFTGTLPSTYANWTRLVVFHVQSNTLEGTVPQAYVSWTQLVLLRLFANRFSGSLPSILTFRLLTNYEVGWNKFTGTLNPNWFQWPSGQNVTHFSVCSNELTGTIPASLITSHRALQFVMLNNNQFSGSVLSVSVKVKVALLHNNPLLNGSVVLQGFLTLLSVCNTSMCAYAFFVMCAPYDSNVDISSVIERLTQSFTNESLCTTSRLGPAPTNATLRHTVAGRGLNAASNVVAVTSVVSAVSGGTSTLVVQRLAIVAALGACGDVSAVAALFTVDSLPVTSSPLQLLIGPVAGAAHRGAVVGNLLSWLLCAAVAAALALSYARRRQMSWLEACAVLRLPGVCFAAVALLLQQVVVSSVLALRAPSPDGWAPADVGIGILGVLAVVCVFSAMGTLLDPRTSHFHARAASVADSQQHVAVGGRCMAAVIWCVRPFVVWHNRERRSTSLSGRFVECFGLLFTGCNAGCHWWLLADVAVTVLLGILYGVAPPDALACAATVWVSVAVCAAWLIATVVVRPKHRRIAAVNSLFSNTAQCAVAVCAALLVDEGVTGAIATAASITTTLLSAVVFVVDLLLRRTSSAPSACRSERPERTARKHTTEMSAVRPSAHGNESRPFSSDYGFSSSRERLEAVLKMICEHRTSSLENSRSVRCENSRTGSVRGNHSLASSRQTRSSTSSFEGLSHHTRPHALL